MKASSLTRRALFLGACMLPLIACQASADSPDIPTRANEARYATSQWRRLTADQWRARLSPLAFQVMRQEGTERAGTSPLLNEHRRGTFVCAGCGLELYRSQWKFDSGTGWPSFFDVIAANVGAKADFDIGMERTEIHCAQCLSHMGHVFPDGPPPTGLRYCMDGVSLRFVPA